MKNLNVVQPCYDAVTEQYNYREDIVKSPCNVYLYDTLIPIIIRRTHSAGTDANLTIYFYNDDGTAYSTASEAGTGLFTITTGTTYDYLILKTKWTTKLPAGSYYIKITDAYPSPDKDWFFERFSVVTTVSTLLKLEFSNNTQLANIAGTFSQTLYINNTLKTPEYIREDTGEKRDGLLVKEKQVLMKAYILREILATEYLIDALMLLPLMDNVTLTTQSGEVMTFDEIRVKADPEWQADAYGSMAKLEILLIKDIVVKKLNFKETGYSGGDMGAIIKTSPVAVNTSASGDYFTYQVVFDEDMPDTNYYANAKALTYGVEDINDEPAKCSNLTIHGFLITTVVECEVRWTAIKQL